MRKYENRCRLKLKKIQQEVGITFIYVTHDQEEALSMSDTVVVMNNGEIQQIGSPTDIYNEPENRFVASFNWRVQYYRRNYDQRLSGSV